MSFRASSTSVAARPRFGAVGDLGEAPHLVGVVERVHHQPLVEGADQHDVLLAVTRPLRDRDLAGVVHRLHQQAVGLVGALLGTQVAAFRSRSDRPW